MSIYDKIISAFGMLRDIIAGKAEKSDIAPEFSTSSTYGEGALVMKDGTLYRCMSLHSGAWDASHFSATTVDGALAMIPQSDKAAEETNADVHGIIDAEYTVVSPGDTVEVHVAVEDPYAAAEEMSPSNVSTACLKGDVNLCGVSVVDYATADSLEILLMDNTNVNVVSINGAIGGNATNIDCAFYGCTKMSSIVFGGGATFGTKATSAIGCFCLCESLASINLPSSFGSSASNISSCFDGCKSLVSADFGVDNKFGEKATDCRACFADCNLLENLDLPKLGSSGVKDIARCFEGCNALSSLTVNVNFGTKATKAERCFKDCSSVPYLLLSIDFGREADNVSECFSGCSNMTGFGSKSYFGSKATNAKGCFMNSGLISDVHYGLTFYGLGAVANDVSYCFSGCNSELNGHSGIMKLNLPEFGASSMNDASYCFNKCTHLNVINAPKFGQNKMLGNKRSVSHCFSECIYLSSLTISSNFGSNSLDASYCFYRCTNIKSISIGEDFGNSSVSNCFGYCKKLNTITGIGKGFGKLATDVSSCFSDCSALTGLTLDKGFGSNATNVSKCFSGCIELTYINLGDAFGSVAEDASYCFSGCGKLSSITLPEGFGSNATNLSHCFSGCSYYIYGYSYGLKTLTLPDGFGSEATDVTSCFMDCCELTTVHFKSPFGAKATSANFCFGICKKLENIEGSIAIPISFSLSDSPLTDKSIKNVINGLVNVNRQSLTLSSESKKKLTQDQISAASAKGWTIA